MTYRRCNTTFISWSHGSFSRAREQGASGNNACRGEASFLLGLGRRYQARGYSAVRFLLRMSRADIGSYLGLRLETVSRLFSRFQTEGLLRIDNRSVEILNATALKLVIGRS